MIEWFFKGRWVTGSNWSEEYHNRAWIIVAILVNPLSLVAWVMLSATFHHPFFIVTPMILFVFGIVETMICERVYGGDNVCK